MAQQQNSQPEIKRFVASSMSRALELVREEMGPEAIILSSRRVDEGVEIVTSVERDLNTRGVMERRQFGQHFDAETDSVMESDNAWRSQAGVQKAAEQFGGFGESNGPVHKVNGEELARAIQQARERMMAAKQQAESGEAKQSERSLPSKSSSVETAAMKKPTRSGGDDLKLERLRGEIADLRMLLEQQVWSGHADAAPVPEKSRGLKSHLQHLGLSDEVVARLLLAEPRVSKLNESWRRSLARLAKQIPIASEDLVERGGVYAFVGPTGVGKTTTVAKLAARFALKHGPGKVALISLDVHRVGAMDQLKSLGKILDAPVRAVGDELSLALALKELSQFKLILIDTAGFRQGDAKLKKQLARLALPALKPVLVLSANSSYPTLKASVHAFRCRQPLCGVVLTKLDEALSLGEAISSAVASGLPLLYTTDGQEIPADIARASAATLVSRAVSLSKVGTRRNVTAGRD